ncbi:hypothetical protein [Maribacter aestuarii]|uniref:hypothetical protein n=1 Tax=Maribacter aestuarii TaxID=1130723 RepID=UPI00248CD8B6|nr:hypothetical protein [Maribacter aestuarii]
MRRFWFLKKMFILLFASTLCSGIYVYSQNVSVKQKIKPAFEDYFGLPRTSVFMHLNKSVYVKGEEIWFKGYLYNRSKGTPFNEPTNLYVGVYDSSGNQIKKELFISQSGIFQGQIMVDSTFNPGLYFIRAATSWMRNFKEDDSYVQQFKVIEGAESVVESGKGDLDVQFLPEGGHLIDGVPATVGVKVLDQSGKGIQGFKGYLVKVSGDTVASFKTNKFGLAKFNFLPKKEENYQSSLIDDAGNKVRFLLPEIEDRGIGMIIKKLTGNRILISLGTNDLTRNEIGNKPFSLLFHRDGLLKHRDITFPPDESFVSYILHAKDLHPRMNIVTLVNDEGNPVTERLVFNSNGFEKDVLSTTLKMVQEDSVQLTLFKKQKSDSLQFLSVSILPLGTLAYQHKKNILSTFLFSPYVKGYIEHPSYYFTEMSTEKENDLDLLLLTQGWSRYDWSNVFAEPPSEKYSSRSGVEIYGKLNFELGRKENLLLYVGDRPDPKMIEIDQGSDEFVVKDYYLEKGDELQFTTFNSKGNLSRPNLYVKLDNGLTTDKIYNPKRDNFKIITSESSEPYNLDNFILPPKTIALDEAVIVEEKKKDKYITSPLVSERRMTKVTEQIKNMYPSVIDIIRSNGFRVVITPNVGYDRIQITSNRNRTSPALYIDDFYQPDFNMLEDIFTTEISSYFIDRSGNAEPGAGGGVIRLYRRIWSDEDSVYDKKDSKFFRHTVVKGFSAIKEFYVPNYSSFTDDTFVNFGTVHWEPNIILDKNGKANFDFDSKGRTEFEIFIEGMGNDGSLFSTRKTIRLNSSQ